ncbi:MAG: natural resistance-associated macrophage protein [Parcubacteria group bacterium]|nr:natural resistance-associated macrophage protein [Parcubacteria group bacterium]
MFDPRKAVKKLFQAPAEALEKTIEFTSFEEKRMMSKKPLQLAGEYFNTLGPGLTTGAADDDPSGIGTYSQTGAQFGFQLLWLSVFTFPFMAIVQEMCARIGLITGQGLAANIRKHHSRQVLYVITALLFAANTLNIAADLGAMSASAKLLFPHISVAFVLIVLALVSLLLQIFTTYARYARFLKYTALALLSYVFTAFAVHINWADALHSTLIPTITFSKEQIFLLCAILGTTISPYLFFWQTSQEVEEDILKGQKTVAQRIAAVDQKGINRMRVDVWTGMFVSNLVMFFIIAACAATLHVAGITNIATADQAASAIRPFGGDLTYFFFALGIIGTGFLAVPVLAGSAAYAMSECFGWKQGLYRKLKEAYAFYGVIIISMLIGIIANFAHLDPIKGLIYSAVANGLVAPVVLFYIVRLSSNKKIMHSQRNHPAIAACGWFITVLMIVSGVAAIASLFF